MGMYRASVSSWTIPVEDLLIKSACNMTTAECYLHLQRQCSHLFTGKCRCNEMLDSAMKDIFFSIDGCCILEKSIDGCFSSSVSSANENNHHA
jgi:hypothetical protein